MSEAPRRSQRIRNRIGANLPADLQAADTDESAPEGRSQEIALQLPTSPCRSVKLEDDPNKQGKELEAAENDESAWDNSAWDSSIEEQKNVQSMEEPNQEADALSADKEETPETLEEPEHSAEALEGESTEEKSPDESNWDPSNDGERVDRNATSMSPAVEENLLEADVANNAVSLRSEVSSHQQDTSARQAVQVAVDDDEHSDMPNEVENADPYHEHNTTADVEEEPEDGATLIDREVVAPVAGDQIGDGLKDSASDVEIEIIGYFSGGRTDVPDEAAATPASDQDEGAVQSKAATIISPRSRIAKRQKNCIKSGNVGEERRKKNRKGKKAKEAEADAGKRKGNKSGMRMSLMYGMQAHIEGVDRIGSGKGLRAGRANVMRLGRAMALAIGFPFCARTCVNGNVATKSGKNKVVEDMIVRKRPIPISIMRKKSHLIHYSEEPTDFSKDVKPLVRKLLEAREHATEFFTRTAGALLLSCGRFAFNNQNRLVERKRSALLVLAICRGVMERTTIGGMCAQTARLLDYLAGINEQPIKCEDTCGAVWLNEDLQRNLVEMVGKIRANEAGLSNKEKRMEPPFCRWVKREAVRLQKLYGLIFENPKHSDFGNIIDNKIYDKDIRILANLDLSDSEDENEDEDEEEDAHAEEDEALDSASVSPDDDHASGEEEELQDEFMVGYKQLPEDTKKRGSALVATSDNGPAPKVARMAEDDSDSEMDSKAENEEESEESDTEESGNETIADEQEKIKKEMWIRRMETENFAKTDFKAHNYRCLPDLTFKLTAVDVFPKNYEPYSLPSNKKKFYMADSIYNFKRRNGELELPVLALTNTKCVVLVRRESCDQLKHKGCYEVTELLASARKPNRNVHAKRLTIRIPHPRPSTLASGC